MYLLLSSSKAAAHLSSALPESSSIVGGIMCWSSLKNHWHIIATISKSTSFWRGLENQLFEASGRTIHCTVGSYATIKEQVFANRGITLSSTQTRRAPNVFNFLRQVECLSRAGFGSATTQFDDAWSWMEKGMVLGHIGGHLFYIKSKTALLTIKRKTRC